MKDALRRDLSIMPAHGSFSHAFANPPYFEQRQVDPFAQSAKAQAHAFGPDDLDLWVKVLHTMVTLRGTVTFVHRAETLGKLLNAMEDRFGDIRVAPLYAREGTAASRVIVQGVKGSKAPDAASSRPCPARIDNQFTPEAEADPARRHGLAPALKSCPACCRARRLSDGAMTRLPPRASFPARFRSRRPVVHVVRLIGAIGIGSPLRPALTLQRRRGRT